MKKLLSEFAVNSEEQKKYILNRLAELLRVDIFCQSEGTLMSYQRGSELNPVFCSKQLRQTLMRTADEQNLPLLHKEENSIYFICIRSGKKHYFAGPLSLGELNKVELHKYYKRYGIKVEKEKSLKRFQFSEMMDIAQLLDGILNKNVSEDIELARVNHLAAGEAELEEQEKILYDIKTDEEDAYHHTYQEERALLDCVREGRVEDALHFTRSMDGDLGKMSGKVLNQWRNTAIVGITLCTRAAIEGGISPAAAYQISDFYINKCDSCQDVAQMIRYRNSAIEKLASEVKHKLEQKHTSSYVEQCRDYVRKHYREKIYLNEIADTLGVSSSYLSRLFSRETGERMQDYIIRVRIERAANLLTYSDESLSKIAEYVNFPSQSYFGKVFREQMQMSPRKYREIHKPKEF